ncbi:MAG: hypothetical protein ACF8MJ_07055 [Phycisphaerales bacterium JB050]
MGESVSVLCESCGYDLTGSTPEGVCGECGEPVAASLPGCRTGSPWQIGGGPVSLARTILAVLTEPRSIWARLQMVMPGSFGLLVANAALAGIVYGVSVNALVAMPPFAIGVCVLSLVEYFGLRFFGKRHGWRVSPAVAMTVVGHAGVAWLVAGCLAGIGFWLGGAFSGGIEVPSFLRMLAGRGMIEWEHLLPVVGFLAGMLVFEVLVYIGVRRCRFANPPTATL